jgi:putative membrane protein
MTFRKLAFVLTVGAAPVAFAANPSVQQQGQGSHARLTHADRTFIDQAPRNNEAQIQFAKLALERSQDPQVKKVAQSILEEQQAAEDKLMAISTEEAFLMPRGLTSDAQDRYDRLSKKTGPAFDAAYLNEVKASHTVAIGLYQDEVKKGGDPSLKAFAKDGLPKLRQQQQQAKAALSSSRFM